MSRFKSYPLWIAIFALIAFISKAWLKWEIPDFDTFVTLFMAVLVAFGVVNNPTDRNHF